MRATRDFVREADHSFSARAPDHRLRSLKLNISFKGKGVLIRCDLVQESRKHVATAVLGSIPFLGPIGSALLIARVQTPFRICTKSQF